MSSWHQQCPMAPSPSLLRPQQSHGVSWGLVLSLSCASQVGDTNREDTSWIPVGVQTAQHFGAPGSKCHLQACSHNHWAKTGNKGKTGGWDTWGQAGWALFYHRIILFSPFFSFFFYSSLFFHIFNVLSRRNRKKSSCALFLSP